MSSDSETGTIGPYRVIGSLGRGGMGEVLLAKDPRLHRKVAIKQIRGGEHPEARQRFQREARLAASLSHASIVSIYDFVEQEEHEFLVMELVDGPSLKVWLEGKVSFADKLRVAEQVAAGLQYAHRFGVVHRDLKTENVLITPEGQAKIADFGIARRFRSVEEEANDETAAANTRDRTELLTREGALLGTYRSMSPEQAQGEQADFRSDLFSFGVLLYEMFAGRSPFQAEKPLETLFNLISHPHPALDEVAPGLPRPLVRLIDQLLEKDRELRPRSTDEVLQQLRQIRRAAEEEDGVTVGSPRTSAKFEVRASRPKIRVALGFAAMLLVVSSLMVVFWPALPKDDPGNSPTPTAEPSSIYVGILPVEAQNSAGDPGAEENDHFPILVRRSILDRLKTIPGLQPLTLVEVDQVLQSSSAKLTYKEIADAVGADELVVPALTCRNHDCRLNLHRWRVNRGYAEDTDGIDLQSDSLGLSAQAVSVKTGVAFGAGPTYDILDIREEDIRLWFTIRKEFQQNPMGDALELRLGELEELAARSPHFIDADLLRIEILWGRYRETRNERYRTDADRLLQSVLARARTDVEVYLLAAHCALWAEEPGNAKMFLEKAAELAPANLGVSDLQALVLEQEGKFREALELWQRVTKIRSSWLRSFHMAKNLMKLGRWQEARNKLDELLIKAPEHRNFSALRAELELEVGEPAVAVGMFEKLVAAYGNASYRANLATAYYFLGDGEKSENAIQPILDAHPNHPWLLIRADARRLRGHVAAANEDYQRVVELFAAKPAGWQDLSIVAQAHARLGDEDSAYSAMSKAIDKAGSSEPNVYVDAALVFTLIRERRRAKECIAAVVEVAKKSGWLRQPEFKYWLDDPDIISQLPPEIVAWLRGASDQGTPAGGRS